ncbi:MAG: hypothetical protein KGJ90_02670 [Patescibacteria group bacterium]|nr:hypothetical protein [Patescibacteria group bacterium]
MLNSAYSTELSQFQRSVGPLMLQNQSIHDAIIALIKADYIANPSKFAWIIKYNGQSLPSAYSTVGPFNTYPVMAYDPYLIGMYIDHYTSIGAVSQDTAAADLMNLQNYVQNLYTVMQSYMAQNNISASQIASSTTYQNAVLNAINTPISTPTPTGGTGTTTTNTTPTSIITGSTVVSGVPNYVLIGGAALLAIVLLRRKK